MNWTTLFIVSIRDVSSMLNVYLNLSVFEHNVDLAAKNYISRIYLTYSKS